MPEATNWTQYVAVSRERNRRRNMKAARIQSVKVDVRSIAHTSIQLLFELSDDILGTTLEENE